MSCSVCQGCGVRVCGTVVDGLCEDCRDLGIIPRGLEAKTERPPPVIDSEPRSSGVAESQELSG